MVENVIGQVRIDEEGESHLLIHYAYRTGKYVFRREQKVAKIAVSCHSGQPARWHLANDVRAVTCPLCKLSKEYMKVAAQVRVVDPTWKG